ncbi:MAG: hypothetical protein RSD22_06570, partial [Romboutsia sp.]
MYNKDCNHPTSGNSHDSDCCISGIRDTFQAIKECVHDSANIPGFGVSIIVTLTNGLAYDINVNVGTLQDLLIYEKVVIAGDLTISLCDVVKIKVLPTPNSKFTDCLKSKLCKSHHHSCKCDNDYFAISMDDDDDSLCPPRRRQQPENRYDIQGKYGPTCKNNSCNSNSCGSKPQPCNPCNQPKPCNCKPCNECGATCKNDCSCTKDMERIIDHKQDDIIGVGMEGGARSVGTVNSMDDVYYKNVLNGVNILTNTIPLLSSLGLLYTTISAANSVSGIPTTVVNSINLQPLNVMTGLNPTILPVLKSITTTPVTVVNGVNLLSPITAVTGLNAPTIPVSGPVVTSTQGVVTTISLLPSSVVTGITTTPISALINLGTPSTSSAISGITPTTLSVVQSVAAPTTNVLKD